jgi:ribosomal protein S8
MTPNIKGLEKVLSDMYIKGFIAGYKKISTSSNLKMIEIVLRYDALGKSLFSFSKVVSKPGRDIVISLDRLKREARSEPVGLGIIRTPRLGITTTSQAINNKTGGTYLGKIK